MPEKEKWGKPKLIILIRGKPEEAVLVGCKREGGVFHGAADFYNTCFQKYDVFPGCNRCNAYSNS